MILNSYKFICPKTKKIRGGKYLCSCESPCTTSSCGRMFYTYPKDNFRVHTPIPRGTPEWDLYADFRHIIEQVISRLKLPLQLSRILVRDRKTAKDNWYLIRAPLGGTDSFKLLFFTIPPNKFLGNCKTPNPKLKPIFFNLPRSLFPQFFTKNCNVPNATVAGLPTWPNPPFLCLLALSRVRSPVFHRLPTRHP
jgi:hypothetical protein